MTLFPFGSALLPALLPARAAHAVGTPARQDATDDEARTESVAGIPASPIRYGDSHIGLPLSGNCHKARAAAGRCRVGDDGRVAFLRVPAQRRDRDRISARPSRPSPLSPSLPFPLSPSARGRARRTSAWRTSAGRRIGHLRGVGIAGACSWTLRSSAAGRAGGCDVWGAWPDSTRTARVPAFASIRRG